jgi:hypothetical protein
MMLEHTPGPWVLLDSLRGPRIVADDADATPVCDTIGGNHQHAKADALLIAAAPDLLAALQEIVADLDDECGNPVCGDCAPWRRARAAIAKATGSL